MAFFLLLHFPSKLWFAVFCAFWKTFCGYRLSGNKLGKLWHIFVLFAYMTHEQHCGRPVWVPCPMPLVLICISSLCPELSLLSNVFACAACTHKLLKQEHSQCWKFQLFKNLLNKISNYAFEFRTGSDFPLQILHVFIFIFNDMPMPKFILKGFIVHYTIYQQMTLKLCQHALH